jgi:hypothetical protein
MPALGARHFKARFGGISHKTARAASISIAAGSERYDTGMTPA